MKRFPLIFILLFLSCTAPRQMVESNPADFNKHPRPYHIFYVGIWNSSYSVLTLVDADNDYFTARVPYNSALKKGDTYTP
jgi:hypothetical protein